GRGTRLGGQPKQYRRIGGAAVVAMSVRRLSLHAAVDCVQPVSHPDDQADFSESVTGLECLAPVFGGATRQQSVRAGLEALASLNPEIVLIHDAARPFASAALVERAIQAAGTAGAAIPGLPVVDAIKSVDPSGIVQRTLDRSVL